MRKYISLIIITLFGFALNVNASLNYDANNLAFSTSRNGNKYYDNLNNFRDFNRGKDVCEPDNSYYNSTQIIDKSNTNDASSNIVYDIAYVDIKDNKLYLYGWAFNKGVDNDLGGTTTRSENDNTWISFALGTRAYGRDETVPASLKFAVTYADPNNANHTTGDTDTFKKLKYYDLTYWNCTRTSGGEDYNGKSTGGLCMDGDTRQLVGGFEASIDLNNVKNYIERNNEYDRTNKKEYYVYMFVNSSVVDTDGKDREAIWFQIGAFDNSNTISNNVKNYEGIKINGLSKKAKIVVSQGRLNGDNGLYCSSSSEYSQGKSKTYFKKGTEYTVNSKKVAYRGANSARYYQTVYQLSIAKPNVKEVKAGNHSTAYAPATWLEFTGKMSISFEKEEIEGVCPSGTKGYNNSSTAFNNYYIFLAKASDNDLDTHFAGNNPMINDTFKHKFSDVEVFKKNLESILGSGNHNLNNIQVINKQEVNLSSHNISDFFDKYVKANSNSSKYVQKDNNFYVIASKAQNDDGTWSNIINNLPSTEANYYAKRSMYSKEHFISSQVSSDNLGYSFIVKRNLYDSDEKNMIVSNPITSADTYYHPILYKISYCVTEQTRECSDIVHSAECYPDDSGTKVIFHEDDRLNTCTLTKNNHSGFNIVEYSETNNYCTVACKDDIDIELPTSKNVTAGQYFTLDNYTPKITAKRTCVTSKINYDTFEIDLKNAEADMIKKYNIWQDYLAYYNYTLTLTLGSEETGSNSICCGNSCGTESNPSCCSGTCSYSYKPWSAVSFEGPNHSTTNISFDYQSGKEGDCGCGCGGTSSCDYYISRAYLQTTAKTNADSKGEDYNTAKNLYNQLVSQYTKCSSWLDNTEFTFNPNVIFDYDDKDSEIFPTEYSFIKNKTEDRTSTTYWNEYDSDTNETYTLGGDDTAELGDSKDKITFNLITCVGKTCDNSDRTINNEFYTSKYIKREETITYEYSLPTLYTKIPNGDITKSEIGSTTIKLENNAVPININTNEGDYDYIIRISGIEDTLRGSTKSSQNNDDNFKERFQNTALNGEKYNAIKYDGNDYVCNYNVINDIYSPTKKALKFFYRTVDLGDINPMGRDLGYNWITNRADEIIWNMENTSKSYQKLTEGSDVFSFTLSPGTMREIRNYNNTVNNLYSDFNLRCEDYNIRGKYHCYSNFLTCLTSGGRTRETGFNSCPLENYSQPSYNKEIFDDNRDILINKQYWLDLMDGIGGT